MACVDVDPAAMRRLRSGHPWVFSNQIRSIEGTPAPGDVVQLTSGTRELGSGTYNPSSLIAVRHLSWDGRDLDEALLAERLEGAAAFRRRLLPDTEAWRVCHGESDFLPGLIVDRYADVHVVQALSAGMDRRLQVVASVLREVLGATSVVERNDAPLRRLEGLPERVGVLAGPDPPPLVVRLAGARIGVDALRGQKTGAFLDQRENRPAAARHARGVRVYDAFCNSGGFGIHAALAGAEQVVGVDSSLRAVDAARTDAERNGVGARCTFLRADAAADMDLRYRRGERFGLVVVDPPNLARRKKDVPAARRALRRLNRRAMTLVARGGILATSTCSHHLDEATVLTELARAAVDAERTLRLLERRGASLDHPVLAAMPESRYLTCVIAQLP